MRLEISLLVLISFTLAGCATHATLSVYSQPLGGYVTELGTGTVLGIAPVNSFYEETVLKDFKDSQGCYLVKGFEARWVSGARAATVDLVRLCGSPTGSYNITLSRDPSLPDLEKDLQFAMQVQALLVQRQQAAAAQDASAAALIQAFTAANQADDPVHCTTHSFGNNVETTCR